MTAVLGRLVIYAKDMDAMVAFYSEHFGYQALHDPKDRIVELNHPDGGAGINLHPAARSQKMGQVLVKPVFDVADVEGFVATHPAFGAIYRGDGYLFSNAKDPSGNSVSVSSRAFRNRT